MSGGSRKRANVSPEVNDKGQPNKSASESTKKRSRFEEPVLLRSSEGSAAIGKAVLYPESETVHRVGIVKFYSARWRRFFIHMLSRSPEMTQFTSPIKSKAEGESIVASLSSELKYSKSSADRAWADDKMSVFLLSEDVLWDRLDSESSTAKRNQSNGSKSTTATPNTPVPSGSVLWETCKECGYLAEPGPDLRCSVCAGGYHSDCLLPYEKGEENSTSFVCPSCRCCLYCQQSLSVPLTYPTYPPGTHASLAAPEAVVVCCSCNLAAHGSCVFPRVGRLPPGSQWRCVDCRYCGSCGREGAAALSAGPQAEAVVPLPPSGEETWAMTFTQCKRCWEGADKGEYCPVCLKAWSVHWGDEAMVQCDLCEFWVHSRCDGLNQESGTLLNQISNDDAKYYCPICRDPSDRGRQLRVLDLLKAQDKQRLFTDPVNPAFLPVYLRVIKQPMDLARMREKEYKNVKSFIADFDLIISNAKTFNMPNTPQYRLAEHFARQGKMLIQKYLLRAKAGAGRIEGVEIGEEDVENGQLEIKPDAMEISSSRQASPYHRKLNSNPSTPEKIVKKKNHKPIISAPNEQSVLILQKLLGYENLSFLATPQFSFPLSPCGSLHAFRVPVDAGIFFSSLPPQELAVKGRWVFYESCCGCGGVGESGTMIPCQVCGESFHASCAGILGGGKQFTCGSCTRCRFCQYYLCDDVRLGYPHGPSVRCVGCGEGWHPRCRPPGLSGFAVDGLTLCESCVEGRTQSAALSQSCGGCSSRGGLVGQTHGILSSHKRPLVSCLVCGRANHSKCSSDWRDFESSCASLEICSGCSSLADVHPSEGSMRMRPEILGISERLRVVRGRHFRESEKMALCGWAGRGGLEEEAIDHQKPLEEQIEPEVDLSQLSRNVLPIFQQLGALGYGRKTAEGPSAAERFWLENSMRNRDTLFGKRRRWGEDEEDISLIVRLRDLWKLITWKVEKTSENEQAEESEIKAESQIDESNLSEKIDTPSPTKTVIPDWMSKLSMAREWWVKDPMIRLFFIWMTRFGFSGCFTGLGSPFSLARNSPIPGPQPATVPDWERVCGACGLKGDNWLLGWLLPFGLGDWIHKECALWGGVGRGVRRVRGLGGAEKKFPCPSPGVRSLTAATAGWVRRIRGKGLNVILGESKDCNICSKSGATVKCVCGETCVHLPCLLESHAALCELDLKSRSFSCGRPACVVGNLSKSTTQPSQIVALRGNTPSAVEQLRDWREFPFSLAPDPLEPETAESKLEALNSCEGVRTGAVTILQLGRDEVHNGCLQLYLSGFASVRLFWGVEAGRDRQAYLCRILEGGVASIEIVHGKVIAVGASVKEAWQELLGLFPLSLRQSLSDLSGDWFFGLESSVIARRSRRIAREQLRSKARLHRGVWLPDASLRALVFGALGLGEDAEPLRSWRADVVNGKWLNNEQEGLGRLELLGAQIRKSSNPNDPLSSLLLDPMSVQSEITDSSLKTTSSARLKNSLRSTEMGGLPLAMQYRQRSLLPDTDLLLVKSSRIHSNGLFAKQAFRKGEMVVEYVGELIRQSVADLREKRDENEGVEGSCYMFRLDEEWVVDATKVGNCARFINHCCSPNCSCRVLECENHKKHIMIFAKKDIAQGEEITYDYQFAVESEKLACSCGAPNCLGRLN